MFERFKIDSIIWGYKLLYKNPQHLLKVIDETFD